jgi:hypothetical protein
MTSDTPDLSRPCAECQHANASNARFCNQCGSRLIESLSPIAPDFKRLTVLFGDLVGSVELSSQLDPEDWHTLLGAYQQAAGDAIRRHRGHVAQLLGDGIVAYFGYPLAGEDDAARAAQAALDMVAAVGALTVRPGGVALRVRVGLHTGAVVMGEVGSGGQRIADSASASYGLMGRGPQLFMLIAVPAQGVSTDAAAAALKSEVARIAREGISEAELQRVKTQWMAGEIYKLDSVFNQAQELGSYWANGMDINTGDRLMGRLKAVTAAQVQSVAQRYFSDQQLTTAVLVPQGSSK